MDKSSFEPRLVHALPPARDFLGRDAELKSLRSLWSSGAAGVVALVGLGGSGKTALAAHFLAELLESAAAPRPDGLFVWSFYQQPDPGAFLFETHRHFGGADAAASPVRGAGLLHPLQDALSDGGRHVIVLDGLERVQQQESPAGGYGRLEDALLRAFLVRVAEGLGRTLALVTSRFPLTDLTAHSGRGYFQVDVEDLGQESAAELLRRRGVRGDDSTLAALVNSYGAHPLTLDHLGTLIGQFLGGDPARAPEATGLGASGLDRQGARLARLLAAYERHLPPAELALLCRLSVLRRATDEQQMLDLFLCTPQVFPRTIREAVAEVAQIDGGLESLDLAAAVQEALEEAHCAAPLAGPEGAYRKEVRAAAAAARDLLAMELDVDFDELAHIYAGAASTLPDEQRPLPADDRASLRALYSRYCELRDHPLLPFREPAPALQTAFALAGWGKPARHKFGDLDPADVLTAFRRARQALSRLAVKHDALRQIRELCRLCQRKWSLAGPLAPLGQTELLAVRDALVQRRLVLRGANGCHEVHPAVRDHFGQLGNAAERGQWHALLRQHLVSLAQRPGLAHPEEPTTLDLVEDAIHHAVRAGQITAANELYTGVLGGLRHLGWRLGEMARGLRILRDIEPCPDRWALGWFLRALGELDEAYRHNDLPGFRADVRLLQGRLPEVALEGDPVRTAAAAFLMGETQEPPPSLLGCVALRAQALLYLGRPGQVRGAVELGDMYAELGWAGERARWQLLLAEASRLQNDVTACRTELESAAGWALHAGSVEHLCLLYLVRARTARDAGTLAAARAAAEEGLRLAGSSGLELYHVELSCALAEVALTCGDAQNAVTLSQAAADRAAGPACRFAWGEAAARHLLGRSLAAAGQSHEAQTELEAAHDLRLLIGDPRVVDTERLLKELGT